MNETNRQILEARAKVLACPPVDEKGAAGRFDTVRFSLAGEEYALATNSVRVVVPLKDLAPIPCTPAFVMGLMNVRGQLVTVINIGDLFGLNRQAISESSKVIIVHAGGSECGIVADAVLGIVPVKADELQITVPTFEGIRQELTRGVTPDGLIVLDALKLLAHPAIIVREEVPG
jgi:purine-binding chemotaxis protein CheW